MCTTSEAWELYCNTSNAKATSLRSSSYRLNLHLLPYWQEKSFHDIKELDINYYRKHLKNKGLSPKSVAVCLSLLRTLMRTSKRYGIFQGEVPHFEMPKFDNKRCRYLSEEDASLLLTSLYTRSELWHDITLFALHTGLRANEIFSLRKEHVNFAHNTVAIFDTKNSKTRVIPLNETSLTLAQKYASKKYTFLFSKNKIKKVSAVFRETVLKAELNKNITDRRNQIVFHSLRHTFASWLVQKSVPLVIVSQLLGHKDIQMTMRYAHLAPDQGKYAVDLLPNNIGSCA